jgi:hypothetical protein
MRDPRRGRLAIVELKSKLTNLLSHYQDQVQRLAEVPGLGVDSAQQVIAEVGASRDLSFRRPTGLLGRGACPGDEGTAGFSHSHRSPKGNRQMRRILNQAANAAVKYKGSVFQTLYRRYMTRLGHNQTIRVISHRLCRLIWKILHHGVRYEARPGDERTVKAIPSGPNDQRAPKPWVLYRTLQCSIGRLWGDQIRFSTLCYCRLVQRDCLRVGKRRLLRDIFAENARITSRL